MSSLGSFSVGKVSSICSPPLWDSLPCVYRGKLETNATLRKTVNTLVSVALMAMSFGSGLGRKPGSTRLDNRYRRNDTHNKHTSPMK